MRGRGQIFPCLFVLLISHSSSAGSVEELLRQGVAQEEQGNLDTALRRYSDALALDPSREESYIRLGRIRLRMGDAREAERALTIGMEHLPSSLELLALRSRARWAQGLRQEAEADLEQCVAIDETVPRLRELASRYREHRRTLAELATWRRIQRVAVDAADQKEATLMVRALLTVVEPMDPAAFPLDTSWFRRGIASGEARTIRRR